MLFEGGRDFTTPSLAIGFRPEADVLSNVKNDIMPKYMPIFEKVASENGTGYLVGDSLTIADLSVLEGLLTFTEYFGKEIFEGFPALEVNNAMNPEMSLVGENSRCPSWKSLSLGTLGLE
ncbi:glutathione S-transferase-like [Aplysia californica]|uniref:Glutathione S-transferase-like n=1 Tax=Aplysia californica TaxID=6500 RepID=A0ABM0K9Z5_APLCA|nr:glutathione S-transferase-like [Aplysia californica]